MSKRKPHQDFADPRDFIDLDEGRETPEPFYAEAQPCESCGAPTFQARTWNAGHELWIAVDCSCNVPDLPTCALLIPLIESAQTVTEVCKVIREHRASCPMCGPKPMPKREPGSEKERKERAA